MNKDIADKLRLEEYSCQFKTLVNSPAKDKKSGLPIERLRFS